MPSYGIFTKKGEIMKKDDTYRNFLIASNIIIILGVLLFLGKYVFSIDYTPYIGAGLSKGLPFLLVVFGSISSYIIKKMKEIKKLEDEGIL
tara:strand:- start:1023 stop:1295 length:273 start_codon:yes stop_codon:yes gene_type:complete